MITDLQRASILKRVSAYILDFILLVTVITGAAFLLSALLDYDSYVDTLERVYAEYEEEYGIDLDISSEDFSALSREEQKLYDEVNKLMNENEEAIEAYNMTVNLALVIASLSILFGYLILEFVIPIIFKNGQTVGKKVFGIGLIRQDGVRITNLMLFVRAILGKCTVETMIPVYILILIIFGNLGMTGTVILAGIAVLQIALVLTSRTNSAIHDMMAATVAVDMSSQMIFESEADMLAYKNKLHAENAARDKYIP
ncbi:MAG: RDD family protein [Clostridia bacterium]|nr:RDD family protein [Clostridia bacterium]